MPKLRSEKGAARRALPRTTAPMDMAGPADEEAPEVEAVDAVISAAELEGAASADGAAEEMEGDVPAYPALSAKELAVGPCAHPVDRLSPPNPPPHVPP